jgi:hypothetical protein
VSLALSENTLKNHLRETASDGEQSIDALMAKEASCNALVENYVLAIGNPLSANSTALHEKLAECEAELRRVQASIEMFKASSNFEEAIIDIDKLVRSNVAHLTRS